MDSQQGLKLVVALLLLYVVYRMYISKSSKAYTSYAPEKYAPYDPAQNDPYKLIDQPVVGMKSRPIVDDKTPVMPPMTVSSDLLPKADPLNTEFAEFAPKLDGNWLQSDRYTALDTVGNSKRNANYQLRSDPPIKRTSVGAWNNSTLESDLLRKPLE
jgi:hypothetical protein